MIILTLLLLEGMAFMLGHILGRQTIQKPPLKERESDAAVRIGQELKNFLSYDGTEQG